MFKSDNELANRLRSEILGEPPGRCAKPSSRTRVSRWISAVEPELRPGAETLLQIVRLCWTSDAFLAQAIYRVKAALLRRGVPILPLHLPSPLDHDRR